MFIDSTGHCLCVVEVQEVLKPNNALKGSIACSDDGRVALTDCRICCDVAWYCTRNVPLHNQPGTEGKSWSAARERMFSLHCSLEECLETFGFVGSVVCSVVCSGVRRDLMQ